jgi:hypothetical protein
MTGFIESIVEEDSHGCYPELGAKKVIEISHADTGRLCGVLRIDFARKVYFEELHRFFDTWVEFLVSPRGGRKFAESMYD